MNRLSIVLALFCVAAFGCRERAPDATATSEPPPPLVEPELEPGSASRRSPGRPVRAADERAAGPRERLCARGRGSLRRSAGTPQATAHEPAPCRDAASSIASSAMRPAHLYTKSPQKQNCGRPPPPPPPFPLLLERRSSGLDSPLPEPPRTPVATESSEPGRRWCCIRAERLGMVRPAFRSRGTLREPPAHSCGADLPSQRQMAIPSAVPSGIARDTRTEPFTTAEHIVDFQVKRVW